MVQDMDLVLILHDWSLFRGNVNAAIEGIVVGLIVLYVISRIYKGLRRVKAPRMGKNPWIYGLPRARADFFKNGKQLTKDGYARYKNSMFWIQTGDMERLVLSNRYLDELRRLPDTFLDSKLAVVERNLGWYNRVDIILKSTAHVDVCRTQLVQNLGTCKISLQNAYPTDTIKIKSQGARSAILNEFFSVSCIHAFKTKVCRR